eukprot:640058-Lingulodinium_polyedra.AAC.1
MELGPGYALASLTLEDDETAYVSQGDIKDCVYERLLPADLARFFAFDRLDGKEMMRAFGVQCVEGAVVDPGEKIWPYLRVCPMG